MRIDPPRCNLKNCRYCFDSNCIKNTEYERCEYRLAKSEAIKEFAERLKGKAVTKFDWSESVDAEDIDNLVKEMTEGANNADR